MCSVLIEERVGDAVKVLERIAELAHRGGLLGYRNETDCLNEIRRLSLPWWSNKAEEEESGEGVGER